jgi:enterochelin esterase-like enzyme
MLPVAVVIAFALLPGFTPAATQPSGGGTVLTGRFPGTLRAGEVYLPPGYTPLGRYPVAYLLHGLPGSPTEYLDGVDLADWADQAIADGEVQPFIAVLPAAGPRHAYNGEWAGPWERAVVDSVVPWIDAHLATIATPAGRLVGGLSAGGFGAVDMALRHPTVFGRAAAWSAYFRPLHDGPFKHASKAVLAANDPVLLVRAHAPELRRSGLRLFLSTGPYHSHWFRPDATLQFVRELRRLRLPVRYHVYALLHGEWRAQVDTALLWAFGRRAPQPHA